MPLRNSILTLVALDGLEAPPPPTMTAILEAVAEVTETQITAIRSVRRTRNLAKVRWLFCWYCVEYTMKSYPQIARFINKDHSTVYYGADKVTTNKADYEADIAAVDILLNGGKLPIRRTRKPFPYVGQEGVHFQ